MEQTSTYDTLTKEQIEQVDYLFADEIFGTDPNAYLYELSNGKITGRRINGTQTKKQGRAQRSAPVIVHKREEPNITPELIDRANMSMEALAVSIAEKLFMQEQEED